MKVVFSDRTRPANEICDQRNKTYEWWLSCGEVFLSVGHSKLLLYRVPELPSLHRI
jgi:hypothetical protein